MSFYEDKDGLLGPISKSTILQVLSWGKHVGGSTLSWGTRWEARYD